MPPSIATLDGIIRPFLAEDIGDGDVTTLCTVGPEAQLDGVLLLKEPGTVAGLRVAERTLRLLDPDVTFRTILAEGMSGHPGDVLAEISGTGRALLTGERVALNLLQRMSGIASATGRFVKAVAGTGATILDTRKTAPGLRLLDKWAVQLGGGSNHRFGLFDMVMIKDNHIAAVGSIDEAVRRVRACDNQSRPIEVEVTDLDQLREALELQVDRILLDNMDPETMRAAVLLARGRTPLEASGGVTLATVRRIAETGVDFISVGSLTHSVKGLDISLEIG